MLKLRVALAVSVGGLSLFAPTFAQAHFMLNSPTSWWTQTSDGSPQKSAPCGNEATTGTSASKVVTNFQPGQTIPVQVTSTVAHPGWWRISLKQGATSTQTATGMPDPPALGAAGSAQQCTPAFMDNPVWSPTQPVIADKLGIPTNMPTSTTTLQSGTKTFNVTIPSNASCTSASPCTLQVLMFMTDHSQPTCNYHHCADITVQANSTGGTGGSGAGGRGGAGGTGAGGRGGAGGSNAGANGRGGTTGSAGTNGGGRTTGAAGTSGTSGAAGDNGSGGTTGAAGDIGTTGAAGTSGGAGTSGDAGTTGSAGTTGAAGDTGSTGTAGTTGSAGTTGLENGPGGCSCTVGEKSGSMAIGVGSLMALAAVVARRRRRPKERPTSRS